MNKIILLLGLCILLVGCSPQEKGYLTSEEAMDASYNSSSDTMNSCILYIFKSTNNVDSFVFFNYENACTRMQRDCIQNNCLWEIRVGASRSNKQKFYHSDFQGVCICRIK
jgi:hypothetical protein